MAGSNVNPTPLKLLVDPSRFRRDVEELSRLLARGVPDRFLERLAEIDIPSLCQVSSVGRDGMGDGGEVFCAIHSSPFMDALLATVSTGEFAEAVFDGDRHS